MLADGHLGNRPGEHGQLLRDRSRHHLPGEARELRHIGPGEEIAQIRILAGSIEMHDLELRSGHSALTHHVRLRRHVGQVLRLHSRRRLHFDDAGPLRSALQDVHGDEDPAGTKRGLVDDRRVPPEGRVGGGDPLIIGVVRQVDEHAVRHMPAGHPAYGGSVVEERLERVVGLELRRLRLVHGPPQPLMALEAREDAGLRKTDDARRHDRSIEPPCGSPQCGDAKLSTVIQDLTHFLRRRSEVANLWSM
jgi:hypothetical protein